MMIENNDLISRKALLEYVKTLEGNSSNKVYKKAMNDMLFYYIPQIINDIPAVDAKDVVHAKWEINSDGYYPYCSHCKNEPENGKMTKWCPECGARMDKE